MRPRWRWLTAATTAVLAGALVVGCHDGDGISTTATETTTGTSFVPTYAEMADAVTIDAEDAAVVKSALASWRQSAIREGDGTPFGMRHGQMQFVAEVGPSLDNGQLSNLVDFLVARNEAHRGEMRGDFAGPHGKGEFLEAITGELGLSAEQRDAMKALHEKARGDAEKQFEAFHGGAITREQLHNALEALRDATREKLAGILTADQLAKFEALHAQRRDSHLAGRLERIGERVDEHAAWLDAMLDLSDGQTAQVRTALIALSNELKASLEALKDDSVTRDELHERMLNAHDAFAASLENILTDAQRTRLEIVRPLFPHGPRHA